MEVEYIEKKTVQCRGPVDPLPDEEIDGLLVGRESVIEWADDHRKYGHDSCSLFPAHYEGRRAWLLRKSWCPAAGYCASGTHEEVLDFEEGVKILIKNGKFEI